MLEFEYPSSFRNINSIKSNYWEGPYTSVEEANLNIPLIIREKGVLITIQETEESPAKKYWYKDGTADENLVEFTSGGGVFISDIPVVLSEGKTLGKYVNGDTIPATGKTPEEVLNLIAQEYLAPTISAFLIQGVSSTIEVGTQIPAFKVFSWTTTQNSNIQVSSGVISERFGANLELATNLLNDNFENITSQIDTRNDEGTLAWRLLFTNTQATTFFRDFTVNFRYKIFYGPIDSNPTNSAEGRALPSERFTNSGNTWTLNTGTEKIKWGVLIPNSKTITSVFDLDASNANITSSYVLIGTINIIDAGGNSVIYKLYVADAAVPYSINHRHEITIA